MYIDHQDELLGRLHDEVTQLRAEHGIRVGQASPGSTTRSPIRVCGDANG
jgi:hypothetical protein